MRLLFTSFLFLLGANSSAQIPTLDWVKGLASPFEKQITDGAFDANHNIYLKGFFKSKLDFDPGPDSFNFYSQGIGDGYVLSLDEEGNFQWAKHLPTEDENGTSAIAIHDDLAYATGHDFGLSVLQSRYVSDGTDTVIHYINSGTNIQIDHEGEIIVCGEFYKKLDFDPSSSDTLWLDPFGGGDAFLAKLSADGELLWIRQIGGTGYTSALTVVVDHENGYLVTGQFSGNLELDNSSPGYELTAEGHGSSFLIKYNQNGDLSWYKMIGSSDVNTVRTIALDEHNHYVIGGHFKVDLDFKDSMNPSIFQSVGDFDIFLAKIDSEGHYQWMQTFGGTEDQYMGDIAVDQDEKIFVLGSFYGTVDFDPGTDANVITSSGYADIFIQEYAFDGAYRNTYHISGPDAEYGTNILIGHNGKMVLLGHYGKSVDFDLGVDSIFYSSSGSNDAFIAKYSICQPSDTMMEVSSCDSLSINDELYLSSGQYVQHLQNMSGCDSLLYLDVTVHQSSSLLVTAEICQGEHFEGYTTSGTYQDIFSSSNGCDSTRTLILQVLSENDPACIGTSTYNPQLKLPVLYPNPTYGILYFENLDTAFTSVQIVSMYGTILKESILTGKRELDISELPSGLYLTRFLGPNESIVSSVIKL